MAMLSLICTLYFASNIELSRRGLGYPLTIWRQKMLARLQITGQDVVLPAIDRPTSLLSPTRVFQDKDHWMRLCWQTAGRTAIVPLTKTSALP